MQRLVNYADELVTSIGPRPGGSKGEHEAAELIAANLENLGLDTWIQEFSVARSIGWVRVAYYLLGVIAAEMLFIVPQLSPLAFILALAAAALVLLDLMGKNPLYNLFNKGLSQNVVAHYVPEGADPRRKVVVVAHYDSGRSMLQCAPLFAPYYVLLRNSIRICVLALLVVALFSLFPLPEILLLLLSVIGLIIGIVLLIAALIEVTNLFLPYNQGANCNASGVAALMGIAETLVGMRGEGGVDTGRAPRSSDARISSGVGSRLQTGTGMRRSGALSEYGEQDDDLSDQAARGSAPGGGLAGIGGAAASIFSKARGLVGRRDAEPGDRDGQVEGTGYIPDDGDVIPPKSRIRSGVPVSRGSARSPETGGDGDPREAYFSQEPGSDSGTADLGLNVQTAARDAAGYPEAWPPQGFEGAAGMPDQRYGAQAGAPLQAGAMQQAGAPLDPYAAMQAEARPDALLEARPPTPALSRIETGATDNPAIRVRAPLAEQQEREIEQQTASEAASRTEDGMPAWYVNAKKAAQEDAKKVPEAEGETKVVRSRYADIPVAYPSEQPSEQKKRPASHSEQKPDAAGAGAAQGAGVGAGAGAVAGAASGAAPGAGAGFGQDATQGAGPDAGIGQRLRSGVPTTREPAHGPAAGPANGSTAALGVAADAAVDRTTEAGRATRAAAQEPPTTLNADFTGIDRLASDPSPTPLPRTRLPESASPLEHAVAAPTPDIPANERLRNLPTLSLGNSGMIPTQQAAFDQQTLFDPDEEERAAGTKKVSNTGSFAPLGATGIMKPVGEELLEYLDNEQDIYVDDADEGTPTRGRTRAGGGEDSPQVMEIPQSRAKSFFSGLGDRISGGRKEEPLDSTPASWLGVDEDFDARNEGSQIGGWGNFSEEDSDDWKGGAYGSGSYEEDAQALADFSSLLIDKEVWLVAAGSHENKNAGILNLLSEYDRELKRALIINMDGVGTGGLFYTVAEGSFRLRRTDHRLQGLVKSASDVMGVDVVPIAFNGYNTEATEALAIGSRAISILGLNGRLPTGWRWSDDRLEILDEDNLQTVVDIVVEIIKSV